MERRPGSGDAGLTATRERPSDTGPGFDGMGGLGAGVAGHPNIPPRAFCWTRVGPARSDSMSPLFPKEQVPAVHPYPPAKAGTTIKPLSAGDFSGVMVRGCRDAEAMAADVKPVMARSSRRGGRPAIVASGWHSSRLKMVRAGKVRSREREGKNGKKRFLAGRAPCSFRTARPDCEERDPRPALARPKSEMSHGVTFHA
jgi:hypothetical protein